MDTNKQIGFWKESAESDWSTAIDIFSSGKNLHFCLFLCHLTVEKLLKALIVKRTNSFPPKTHNLLRLAEISELKLYEGIPRLFQELNQFQLDTRYPDEKFTVYKLATKEFTTERIEKVKEVKKWILEEIKK